MASANRHPRGSVCRQAGRRLRGPVCRRAGRRLRGPVCRRAGRRLRGSVRCPGGRAVVCGVRCAGRRAAVCGVRCAGGRAVVCGVRCAGGRAVVYGVRCPGGRAAVYGVRCAGGRAVVCGVRCAGGRAAARGASAARQSEGHAQGQGAGNPDPPWRPTILAPAAIHDAHGRTSGVPAPRQVLTMTHTPRPRGIWVTLQPRQRQSCAHVWRIASRPDGRGRSCIPDASIAVVMTSSPVPNFASLCHPRAPAPFLE